jgi:hypothetical protein
MESSTPVAVLKTFASSVKKKVLPCNLFDANVSVSIMDDSTNWELKLLSGYVFTHQIRMLYRKRRVVVTASEEFLGISVEGSLGVGLCSINRPNKISFVKSPSTLTVAGDLRWPVFVSSNTVPSMELLKLLDRRPLHAVVSLLVASSKESLHIFRDSICAYSCIQSTKALHEGIDLLCELVAPQTKISRADLKSLPTSLMPLIPLIQKWSEGDDAWREDKLQKSSRPEIQKLISSVNPFMDEIDRYLESHDDEAAHALGSLAECVAEARLDLNIIKVPDA